LFQFSTANSLSKFNIWRAFGLNLNLKTKNDHILFTPNYGCKQYKIHTRNSNFFKPLLNNNSKIYKTFAAILFVGTLLLFGNQQTCKAQQLTNIEKLDSIFLEEHSPRKASLYSAILPGLGQAYNRRYWKIPIIYIGGAALVYSIMYTNGEYSKAKRLLVMVDGNDPLDLLYVKKELKITGDYDNSVIENFLLSNINSFRRYRDLNALGLAALYLANIIDATVDAYLYDYDVSQDLSLKIKPTIIYSPYSQDIGLSCSLRF
jgi:hypothetical protein